MRLGVLWAWAGLFLALGAPEGDPVFELQLAEGKGGVLLKGRLAELVEDESGIRVTLDYPGRPGSDDKEPEVPKLPDGITVKYLPPADMPRPPRIEVEGGIGPIRLPSGATMVAARDFIFKIDRDGVRIVEAPQGSPLRRKLERMEEYNRRHPELRERREQRRDKFRDRLEDRRPFGERRGMQGQGGDGDGGPQGPPPDGPGGQVGGPKGPPPGGQGGDNPPPGDGQGGNNPPPPPADQGR